MYYVYIEAWCLGYAVNFLLDNMRFANIDNSTAFWGNFIGVSDDGEAIKSFGIGQVGIYLLIAFILNFYLIYRGISKGIELFCKLALPTLILLALIILVRVLTLGTPDPNNPEASINNGLGFLWNPQKTFLVTKDSSGEEIQKQAVVDKHIIEKYETKPNPNGIKIERVSIWKQLRNPQLWLAAAGQIFFSLSVGFGVIITYASYLKKKDDIVLSGLSATSTNQFCEVTLGGLITIPAAVAFIGVAGLTQVGLGTFDLGFKVLPLVFSKMPLGNLFGFLWFFLLFLAAVTSSISMLQPGITFFEETLRVGRRSAVALLGTITVIGCGIVVYFSKGIKALDTLDFWVGTFLIFTLATFQIILFSWGFGIEKGFKEAHHGSAIRIPSFFKPIMRYLCPFFLVTIFVFWLMENVFGLSISSDEVHLSSYVTDLFVEHNPVALISIGFVIVLFIFLSLIVSTVKRYKQVDKNLSEKNPK